MALEVRRTLALNRISLQERQHVDGLLKLSVGLCERDEVKDWLHGVLVARMDELHRRRPELVKEAKAVMSDPDRR